MSFRLAAWRKITLVAVLAVLFVPATGWAAPEDAETTEDILYLTDGRELHGRILSETATEVVFEIVARNSSIKSRRTFRMAEIAQIERGVALASAGEESKPARTPGATTEPVRSRYGRGRRASDALDVPAIYVVAMKGQMGTDIHRSVYEKVLEDIRVHEPDVIVFELDSKDYPDLMIPEVEDPRESKGILLIAEYREIVSTIQDELSDIRQVMWVRDSVGFSSLLALAWPELYMTPTARLWGLRSVIDTTGADKWSDPDVRAKMSAAITGYVKAFLEYGGYSAEVADAMLWPEKRLSASFKGREVVWSLNDQGEFIVDNDESKTLGLRAKTAEDLLISDGTVENLDDLAFLLGYREYRVIEGKGQDLVEDYVEQWRRVYEQTKGWWADYYQHKDWATGADTLKWLGRAKRDVEQIINAMERYEAVEIRWQTDLGVKKFDLETLVEQLKEQIQALKTQGRGGGYGVGGRGLGGGG
ncbi:MAG: Clp protease/crotonase-like domain-containing protein [Planctomycetota bacterium]|jgi:hypothetical protein